MKYQLLVLICFFVFWQLSQSYLSTSVATNGEIIDRIHDTPFVMKINSYLRNNTEVARILIALTSLMIDGNVAFIAFRSYRKSDYKIVFIMMAGLTIRQFCQFINRLPIPPNMIWFNPGIPSFSVTYGVSNDFFFSGHTFISILLGVEIAKSSSVYAKLYGFFFIVFEISFVLVTHGHYFMDVYAAIATYFMMQYFMDYISKRWSVTRNKDNNILESIKYD